MDACSRAVLPPPIPAVAGIPGREPPPPARCGGSSASSSVFGAMMRGRRKTQTGGGGREGNWRRNNRVAGLPNGWLLLIAYLVRPFNGTMRLKERHHPKLGGQPNVFYDGLEGSSKQILESVISCEICGCEWRLRNRRDRSTIRQALQDSCTLVGVTILVTHWVSHSLCLPRHAETVCHIFYATQRTI